MWAGVGSLLVILQVGPALGFEVSRLLGIGDGPLAVALMIGSGYVLSAMIFLVMMVIMRMVESDEDQEEKRL